MLLKNKGTYALVQIKKGVCALMSHMGTIPEFGFMVYQVKYRFVFLKTSYDILQTPLIAWQD